jgi:hypothetical protein
MKRKSQILGGGKETKNWVILCARSMTPGLICSHALVCTITCKKTDKRPGVGDVNGTRVVADSVSHTYTNNSCTVSTNSQHLPVGSHYKTSSQYYIHTYPTLSVLVVCNLKPLYGQTFPNVL